MYDKKYKLLEELKNLLFEINNNSSSFYQKPDKYLKKIFSIVKELDSQLENELKNVDLTNISKLQNIIFSLNILLSEQQKKYPIKESLLDIKGVGDKVLKSLNKLKIFSIEDLLFYFPFRYESITNNEDSSKKLYSGKFIKYEILRTKTGKKVFRAIFQTNTGFITAVWFKYGNYIFSLFKDGCEYNLYGEVKSFYNQIAVFHPEILSNEEINKIRPVYSINQDITQKKLYNLIQIAVNNYKRNLPDYLPYRIIKKHRFPEISSAVETIHFPQDLKTVEDIVIRKHKALQRFIYEDFFYIQLGFLLKNLKYKQTNAPSVNIEKKQLEIIKKIMPFKLTKSQKSVLKDILNDLASNQQMNRLIQGDVGSGKTIIAFISALVTIDAGYQVAIIAPTEVLAEQHYINFKKFAGDIYNSTLLTGSTKKREKEEIYNQIKAGKINFVIGTHAVFQEGVEFKNLGLAIIDEQHRFGVLQRKSLIEKGYSPNILLMTATPIPRTLSLSVYGDLDISIIDEMPPGRIPIITRSASLKEFNKLIPFLEKEINKGRNIYFVYPLIEESLKSDLQAATQGFENLKKHFNSVALLHGKMKSEEKQNILHSFKDKKTRILVSTTVIEVGVDMPDATVMVVMNAERFGLAQLHQLRGRVGRSNLQSYCFLMHSDDLTDEGIKRIDAMCKYESGFKLSEIDLELRGPGDFFGVRQSGLPDLKFADILRDKNILQIARKDAKEIITDDPFLEKSENFIIKQAVKLKWSETFDMINIG